MSLTRSLAVELSSIIQANCVLLDAIDTPMPADRFRRAWQGTEDGRRASDVGIPIGRIGQPLEVA